MSEKKGFSSLSDLTSEVHSVESSTISSEQAKKPEAKQIDNAPSHKLPGELPKAEPKRESVTKKESAPSQTTKSGHFLLSLPWKWIIFGVVAVYAAVMYFQGQADQNERQKLMAAFEANVPQYLMHIKDLKTNPKITGKVLPIDLSTKMVSSFYYGLRTEYKPRSAEEVKFVLAYTCHSKEIGRYSDGAGGYQKICRMNVIDVAQHAWGRTFEVKGSEPPYSKKGSGERTGSDPVKDYLSDKGLYF